MLSPQERLSAILNETAALMEADGNQNWADWLRDDAAKLESGDVSGAEHFLRAFGGMGSINDTYGRPGKSKPEDEKSLVEKICDKLDVAWGMADRISRQNRK